MSFGELVTVKSIDGEEFSVFIQKSPSSTIQLTAFTVFGRKSVEISADEFSKAWVKIQEIIHGAQH